MSKNERKFLSELETFREEAEATMQFLYAWTALQVRINEDREFRLVVNNASLMWRTMMGGLQTSFFIILGRVFDSTSKHNVYKLLSLAETGRDDIFSKAALENRKRAQSSNADEWIADYMKGVYVPKKSDFVRLRRYVDKHKATYDNRYRRIRNKVFAHKEASAPADLRCLFANTNLRELELICVFLKRLHETLWQLTHNGKKPILRPYNYSIKQIRKRDKKDEPHERVVYEVFNNL